jgi:hypothetical protein
VEYMTWFRAMNYGAVAAKGAQGTALAAS